jgi:hemerythrin
MVRLAGFLPEHIRYEEETMHRLRFPDLPRHAETHDFLLRQLNTVVATHIPKAYLGKVQSCLIACLENHLYIDDPEFIAHVVDHDGLFDD